MKVKPSRSADEHAIHTQRKLPDDPILSATWGPAEDRQKNGWAHTQEAFQGNSPVPWPTRNPTTRGFPAIASCTQPIDAIGPVAPFAEASIT